MIFLVRRCRSSTNIYSGSASKYKKIKNNNKMILLLSASTVQRSGRRPQNKNIFFPYTQNEILIYLRIKNEMKELLSVFSYTNTTSFFSHFHKTIFCISRRRYVESKRFLALFPRNDNSPCDFELNFFLHTGRLKIFDVNERESECIIAKFYSCFTAVCLSV